MRCNFIKFTDVSGSSEPLSRSFGIYLYQFWATVITTDGSYIVKTCQEYPDTIELDGAWKAARAFTIITFVLVIILLIGKCCLMCNNPLAEVQTKLDTPMYLLIALSQGLMLLLLSSNVCKSNPLVEFGNIEWQETCSLDTGAKCTTSALVFWALAAVTSYQEQRSLKEERANVGQPDVSLTEPLAGTEA